MEIRIPQNDPSKRQPNQPPWKRRLEKQLTDLRADMSKLTELSASRLQNKKRHGTVARAVHWGLCKKYQMPCNNKWYEHQPQPVTENENAKLLWGHSIRTDRGIPAHRPDLTPVDKTIITESLIDVAVPWDSRAEQKEQEKKEEINTKTHKLSSGDYGISRCI